MPAINYSHLSSAERLELIGEIWDCIEANHIPLTAEQAAELDRCYATLDQDIKRGRNAFEVCSDLTARYR
jgi:putative addiction module component (TIGR02574 family)